MALTSPYPSQNIISLKRPSTQHSHRMLFSQALSDDIEYYPEGATPVDLRLKKNILTICSSVSQFGDLLTITVEFADGDLTRNEMSGGEPQQSRVNLKQFLLRHVSVGDDGPNIAAGVRRQSHHLDIISCLLPNDTDFSICVGHSYKVKSVT